MSCLSTTEVIGKILRVDGFLKSPSAALHCILRHCSVTISTLHSSGFVRLASGAFYFAIPILTFYKSIRGRMEK